MAISIKFGKNYAGFKLAGGGERLEEIRIKYYELENIRRIYYNVREKIIENNI